MKMQYKLRQCTEDDRDWAYALMSEVYREVVERQFGPWNEKFQRELFAAKWNPKISSIILMGGRAVGRLAIEKRKDEVWLDEIQIAAPWRGRGLGSRIIRSLLGRQPLRLQVLKENLRARQLYIRIGFETEGETQTHYLMRHSGSVPNNERPNKSVQENAGKGSFASAESEARRP